MLPLVLEDAFVEDCRASLPELPDAKRARYVSALGLSAYDAAQLTAEVEAAREFEALLEAVAAKAGKPAAEVAKRVANWLGSERPGVLNAAGGEADLARNTVAANVAIVVATAGGVISGSKAKEIFAGWLTGGVADLAGEIAANQQTSDTGAIDAVVAKVLADNADKVAQYRAGKEALFGFFVGQTMKAMAGKANPQVVNAAVKAALG